MKNTVSLKWLLARMYEPDLIIVDCRSELGKPGAGHSAFEAGHIPGAVHLDTELDLSGPLSEHGGRHPLPSVERLADVFSKASISRDKRVVAYDDQGGLIASRLWWLLRYTGHEHVFVAEEGFLAWRERGYPVTQDKPIVIPAKYAPVVQPQMIASMEDVREASAASSTGRAGGALLIDSREPQRYRGEAGPMMGRRPYSWRD